MAQALTGPSLVAALLLCVAGVAKLRAPEPAVSALASTGRLIPPGAIRAFAAVEVALGGFAAVHPGRELDAALAAVYLGFAALGWVLAAHASACGCFGASESPASRLQSLLSVALASACAGAAIWPAHGLPWILHYSPAVATAFAIGIVGAVFGTMTAYTELPAALTAWSPP